MRLGADFPSLDEVHAADRDGVPYSRRRSGIRSCTCSTWPRPVPCASSSPTTRSGTASLRLGRVALHHEDRAMLSRADTGGQPVIRVAMKSPSQASSASWPASPMHLSAPLFEVWRRGRPPVRAPDS